MASSTPDDPVFLHSRREAVIILLVWVASLAWTIPYCYLTGYPQAGEEAAVEVVLGMPAWAVWGVVVPWLVSAVVSVVICLYVIQDDDLGEVPESEGP